MTVINQIKALNLYPYAFHITSISNLQGIAQEQGIKCRNRIGEGAFTDISKVSVQSIRFGKKVPGTDRTLHDYVPFFLTFKAPMVAMRQSQNEDLVYIQVSLDIFSRIPGCFVTDGNATNANTKFEPLTAPEALKILDLSVLYKVSYAGDKEKSRKKAAELLIPDFVPQNEINALIFYNEAGRDKGLANIADSGINPPIKVWPEYFFKASPAGRN